MAIHRPRYERLLFGLALIGVLVTGHLNIWYGSAAAQADDPVCGVGFDCQAVLASDPAPLGVPSAVWGLLFYLSMAALCAAIAFWSEDRRPLLKTIRAVGIGFGLLYSLFLTGYQFFGLSDRCLLCLLSALTVTVMAVVQGLYLFKAAPAHSHRETPLPSREYKVYGILTVLLVLFVGADFGYYSTQEKPALAAAVGEALPVAEDRPVDVSQCRFDTEKPYYSNVNMLISDDDPMQGKPDAPVTLIEFLDPNCPHCKTVHPIMKGIAAKYPDHLRVVYKPVAIVGSATHSLEEVIALHLANEQGKFTEMLDYEFVNQNPRQGISAEALSEYAGQLGLDEDKFARDIAEGRFNEKVQRTFLYYQQLGLSGVPTVILEGRVVHSRSRSVGCLSYFIDQELAAKGLMEEAEVSVDGEGTAVTDSLREG